MGRSGRQEKSMRTRFHSRQISGSVTGASAIRRASAAVRKTAKYAV